MFEVIPAIDIIGGRCVRLMRGDFARVTEYSADPIEMAKQFQEAGLNRLHLVDLDGAKIGRPQNLPVLKDISRETALSIDFSGGLRRDEHLQAAMAAGADMVSIGSLAVRQEEKFFTWLDAHGAERVFLSADVRDGQVAISGWEEDTGLELLEFLERFYERGVRRVMCTDISKDGLLSGPSLNIYSTVLARFPELYLIASGGITTIEDLKKLKENGLAGAIVGKAIYENMISLEELGAFACSQNG